MARDFLGKPPANDLGQFGADGLHVLPLVFGVRSEHGEGRRRPVQGEGFRRKRCQFLRAEAGFARDQIEHDAIRTGNLSDGAASMGSDH
ncbi:hypothetical protein AYO44_11360 [Planctomycetaceae bacterium SCGC AG-212-F19]|nr:hypothetical protein AYO44_11360 [Planctomycetaceae bacterium SCGC AG-212-F19]